MKLKITIAFFALSSVMIAQTVPYWKLGGNPAGLPVDAVNTTNNYLGTNAANNTFLKIGVQGSQDIFIDNNPAQLYPPSQVGNFPQGGHWVGLGRIFAPSTGPGANTTLSPKAHLHIHGRNNSPYTAYTGFTRNWFDTGVLLTEESDGMYVGLKRSGLNQSNAIIKWSDDAGVNAPTDFLQFNFPVMPI